MALPPQKPRRVSAGILAIILSLFSIAIMTLWTLEGQDGLLHRLRAASMLITAPFQHVGTTVGTPIDAAGEAVENATTSSESIEDLQVRNDELAAEIINLEEARLENERLSSLLRLTNAYSLDTTGARIISRSTDSWNRTLTIDKGSADGMTVGMPVLSADGLIGQIETVGPFSSVVRLITDQRSGVAVFLQGNRSEGVLTGAHDGLLYLSYIPTTATIVPGDAVITSGAGGVYPKGLVIGVVESVTHQPSDVYLTIVVTPIRNVTSFEEVAIITGRQSEVTFDQEAYNSYGATPESDNENSDDSANATEGTGEE